MKKNFWILFFLSILLFCWSENSQAQNARKHLNKLTSKQFKGRGYANDGVQKAKKYLIKTIKKNKNIEVSTHSFLLDANTFENKMDIKIDGKEYTPGIDFILQASSPGLRGSFNLSYVPVTTTNPKDYYTTLQNNNSSILLFDQTELNNSPDLKEWKKLIQFLHWRGQDVCHGIVISNKKKLTFSSSQWQAQVPIIELKDSISHSAKNIDIRIDATFKKEYKTENILVKINGTNNDSSYVFTAHYDHIGQLGRKTYFPGANDNASGCVFLLDLIKHYAQNPPPYTMYFIFFSGEEIGLLGSKAFVEDKIIPTDNIKILLNVDIFGTGVDGIQIVNSTEHKKEYNLFNQINNSKGYIKQIKTRGHACNSDHCAFDDIGVKTFFLYTLGGTTAYHDVYDKANQLPLTKFEELKSLVIDFIKMN
jgi:hypothetical protein